MLLTNVLLGSAFEDNTVLTLFDMGFLNRQSWGHESPHHNFVVIASTIMKFATCIKPDVFYTMVAKEFVTSLLLRNEHVITCILADV